MNIKLKRTNKKYKGKYVYTYKEYTAKKGRDYWEIYCVNTFLNSVFKFNLISQAIKTNIEETRRKCYCAKI